MVRITTPESTGTGFIFDKEGLILTNAHVVGDFSEVTVVLGGRFEFVGEVIGLDEDFDLAVVRIEPTGELPALTFGDYLEVRVGDDAIAIGHPLGQLLGTDPTVTKGVISAVRRTALGSYWQTDASINPGSSGGPLVTVTGAVIGINTAKIEDAFGRPVEGIGLAVSVEDIQRLLPFLKAGAFARRSATPTLTPAPGITPSPTPTTTITTRFGPVDGAIPHQPDDGRIEMLSSGTSGANAVIEGLFFNPYPTSLGDWSNGFLFRNSGVNEFHAVVISSNGSWYHYVRIGNVESQRLVQSQSTDEIRRNPLDKNHLRIVTLDQNGWLFINGAYVGKLNLSGWIKQGDVAALTGYFMGSELAGKSTKVEGFSVSPLRIQHGPAYGDLAHNPDAGFIVSYSSGVNLADFVAEVRLWNPYATSVGSWSTGLELRNSSSNVFHSIVLHSSQRWFHILRQGSLEDTQRVQEIESSDISTISGGSNHLLLIALDDDGWLFINGKFAGELDLRALDTPGDVKAITGYFSGDQVAGEATPFEDLKVYSMGE